MFTPEYLRNIFVIKLGTVSVAPSVEELPEPLQHAWNQTRESASASSGRDPFIHDAPQGAEFGRVACISSGYLRLAQDKPRFRIKTLCSPKERDVLEGFGKILAKYMSRPGRMMCGHNARKFDLPFLARRYLVNGLPVPPALQVQGKKPSEIPFLDTLELWQFGDHDYHATLPLMAAALGIPGADIHWDQGNIHQAFWGERDFQPIEAVCEAHVITTAQVLLRFSGRPLLNEKAIEKV